MFSHVFRCFPLVTVGTTGGIIIIGKIELCTERVDTENLKHLSLLVLE